MGISKNWYEHQAIPIHSLLQLKLQHFNFNFCINIQVIIMTTSNVTTVIVDVLPLPQLNVISRITARSLHTLANMIHDLANCISDIEEEIAEEKVNTEVAADDVDVEEDEELMTALRVRCDTMSSEDSGFLTDSEFSLADSDTEDLEEQSTRDPETGLDVIALDSVRDHCTIDDGWMVLYDRVYDVTGLLSSHPGGEEVMAEYLGYDATMAFRGVGHSKAALNMLRKRLVGILPKEERLNFHM